MLSKTLVLVLVLGTLGLAQPVTFGGPITSAAIPDGVAGTVLCNPGTELVRTVTVPAGFGTASNITVTLGLAHTWYGDVKVILTSPTGAQTTLLAPGCEGSLDDPSDLNGLYVLADTATTLLDAAAVTAADTAGVAIPAGTYRPDGPIAGLAFCGVEGTWTFRFRDFVNFDTGSVNHVAITLTPGTPATTVPIFITCQPSGAGSPFTLIHAGGRPNATYFNPAVAGAGNTPNGWFFGLNIGWSLLLAQATFPPPVFTGTLSAAGFSQVAIPNAPAGLTLGLIGIHFDAATGAAYFASNAFDTTIL